MESSVIMGLPMPMTQMRPFNVMTHGKCGEIITVVRTGCCLIG